MHNEEAAARRRFHAATNRLIRDLMGEQMSLTSG